MSQTQILLYNFTDEDRLRQIRRYLNRHRIPVRMVQQPEYLESLGFLFEVPGFSKNPVFNLGKNFQEEMMVLCPSRDTWDRERFEFEQEYDRIFTGFGFEKEQKNLNEKAEKLLSPKGLSFTDLSPRYACEKCNDTGYVGTHRCDCFDKKI